MMMAQRLADLMARSGVSMATLQDNASLNESFLSLLESSFEKEVRVGSLVVGEVLRREKDTLIVDIGGKYEGLVHTKEILSQGLDEETIQQEYAEGAVREFFVVRDIERDLRYVLSTRRVQTVKNWQQLLALKEAQETLEATITGSTKGGLLASVCQVKGFIPASQLRMTRSADDMIGETLPVKILEVDRQRNKLILSHRQAIFEQKAASRAETLQQLEEGTLVKGQVVKVTDFGVFIDIHGIDGLLPLSEITWRRIKHPSDALALGDALEVRVLSIDIERQRISLSLKRLQPDPWTLVEQFISEQPQLRGQITKALASGVLVEIMPGVEAFCPYAPYGRIFVVGEQYNFSVVSTDIPNRRITLQYHPQEATETASV
ncbi:MAG: 30S ribosomal protein S1 [Vampirovibrionales bacterium]